MAWLVSTFFATLFYGRPYSCKWKGCLIEIDYTTMYLLVNLTDVLLDIGILCLPAFFIQRLQLNRSQKRGVIFMFGSGIL